MLDSLENCRLKKLSVAFNDVGMRGLSAILDCAELSGLTELDMCRTGIDDSAVDLLASSSHLRSLKRLAVADNLTGSTWRELFSSENLPALSEVFVDHTILSRDQ